MIQIVDIERRGSIYTVRFEDAPPLRCSRNFARRLRFSAGQQIDAALLERVRETAGLDLAQQLAERLLRRPRSRRELAARLRQEGVPESAMREALEELEAEGGHDEGEDALALARQCVGRNGEDWNDVRQRCGARLRRRGFSPATALHAVQTAWREQHEQREQQERSEQEDGPQLKPDDEPQAASIAGASIRSRVP